LYFAAGSYYLFKQTDHGIHTGSALGWKVRLDVDMGHYFTLGALVTHDHIFKTRVQGYLGLNIPLGPWKSMKDSSKNLERRRIIRNEIIPVQSRKKSKVPLTSTGLPGARFLFVNNLAPLRGDGTFERPFASLKEAETNSKPGDVIYVYPGDKTPRHLNEGIILKENQILASSSGNLVVDNVVIPAQTPGERPIVTNIHPNRPAVVNPGKSDLRNFYYMNPWDYLQLYDAPSSVSVSDSGPSHDASTYDSVAKEWVGTE
jgi:hypothetical protein